MCAQPARVPKIYGPAQRCVGVKVNNDIIMGYIQKAREMYRKEKYVKAHSLFIKYFDNIIDPQKCDESVKKEFVDVVSQICYVLEQEDNFEELLKCYIQAINLFPNNFFILNELGAYLYRAGEKDIAKKYIEDALKYNKAYLPAEKNLLHIKWAEVPRWHFRMLNDCKRNEAYHRAISKAIHEGYKNVYDIGSGCGLLSLMAADCDPEVNVIAIEEERALYNLSKQIFEGNNKTNIYALNINSTKLDLSNRSEDDVPLFLGNLLVTEIFDVALFGEHALDTLVHAVQNLVEPDFRIIPAGATVFATGIACIDIVKHHRVVNIIDKINLHNLCIRQRDPPPYEAEFLNKRNVVYITETMEVMQVEFGNLNQLLHLKNGFIDVINLRCVQTGPVHALAIWFNLHLDEETVITTDPGQDCVTCWEQAIFYLDHTIYMNQNDTLSLEVSIINNQLGFKVLNYDFSDCQCFTVSKDIVTFLNDEKLVSAIAITAGSYHPNQWKVFDLHVFPLFGMLLAKKGASFCHAYQHSDDLVLLDHLLKVNNISKKEFAFVSQKCLLEFISMIDSIDLLFYNPVNISGDLNKTPVRKSVLDKWKPKIVPEQYNLEIVLVESSYLVECNRVVDSNVLGFHIGEYMNEYTGDQHAMIEVLSPRKSLSNSYSWNVNRLKNGTYEFKVPITANGTLHGIYYWFNITYFDKIKFDTLTSLNHYKNCFLLKQPKTVKKGDTVTIHIQRHDEHFKISVV